MSAESVATNQLDFVQKYCKYVNRKVVLKTIKSSHTGALKCIDPLTQTIALIVTDSEANTSKVVLAMSHSIRSIQLVDDNELSSDPNSDDLTINLRQFLSTDSMTEESNDKSLSDKELTERKQNVINWLRKNRIPCSDSEDGSLCVAYALTLRAPFGRDQCICANEMVLHQIQALLTQMPNQSNECNEYNKP